jgi:hypothetical protein
MMSIKNHSSRGRLNKNFPERKAGLKLSIPVSRIRWLKRINIAPEKRIAGNMYLSSVKKTMVFFTNKNMVITAITSNTSAYQ